jgi:dTDP-4-dehydrorhamnose reductase
MNLLIFGENGQVANELKLNCPAKILPIFIGRRVFDLTNETNIQKLFQKYNPSYVINAAAFTDVDQSEKQLNLIKKINAKAPKLIANAAKNWDIPYIHISTDYVFNIPGTDPINETVLPNPISAYGKSKLEGELSIIQSNCDYIILRTSWIFSKHGNNFVKTIINLAKTNNLINVVNDQIGGPTPASEIAKACFEILLKYNKNTFKSQILHFSGFPDVSWADFANEIISYSKYQAAIRDVSTNRYRSINENYIAERPSNSRLDCNLINRLYSIKRPDWRAYLSDVIAAEELEQ